MVNTYAAQSGGCRFESLWGFGFSLKGAYYEVGYCGKKNFLSWTAMHIDFVMCNNKKTSKCQVFSSTVPKKPKSRTELARPFGFLTSILLQNFEERPLEDFEKIFKKVSQCRNNTEHFSKKRYIRYTLYPVCVKSALR